VASDARTRGYGRDRLPSSAYGGRVGTGRYEDSYDDRNRQDDRGRYDRDDRARDRRRSDSPPARHRSDTDGEGRFDKHNRTRDRSPDEDDQFERRRSPSFSPCPQPRRRDSDSRTPLRHN
jgi:hypothetical protein